ncbi:MAG: SH3 domain-containing protein [Kiritimatiellia bacterium]
MSYRNRLLRSAAAVMLMACTAGAAEKMMSVQVQKAPLRASPGFLGQMVCKLDYGVRVTVVQKQSDWIKVRDAGGKTGWVHQSALTPKRIKMTAGIQDAKSAASGDELALAGKGFNSDVEAQFRAQNSDADFTWVDKMEKIVVTPEQSEEFLKNGGVRLRGGAQ